MRKETRFCFRCLNCGSIYPQHVRRWRCDCGGAFDLGETLPFSREAIEQTLTTMWRYRAMLLPRRPISLGEGGTPMVETHLHNTEVLLKLEYLAPTGSFKDRGTSVLVSVLSEMGVEKIVEDSSGNAGASLAAYAAKAGIGARIYVPAYASPAKLAQIRAYGASLHPIEGPRERAAQAALVAAEATYYASHYWSPLPIEGFKTIAYEIVEDLNWRAPANLVLPVGHGTLLLGLYRGFMDLFQAELIEKLPRFFAVQARACAPIYEAYKGQGPSEPSRTVAEGISITKPLHILRIIDAIRATDGDIVAVEDKEILRGQDLLARCGFLVEPTSAVPVAALPYLAPRLSNGITVIPLTGSGLKTLGRV